VSVLSRGAKAKIAFSVVQTIAISVVNKHSFWSICNLTMHKKHCQFIGISPEGVGIKGIASLLAAPFAFCQMVIVIGIDYGEFALSERYEFCPVAFECGEY